MQIKCTINSKFMFKINPITSQINTFLHTHKHAYTAYRYTQTHAYRCTMSKVSILSIACMRAKLLQSCSTLCNPLVSIYVSTSIDL